MTKDMTVGSPTKLIAEFAIPTLFGMLFQQVYNLVDTIIVGKFIGVSALAGVGSTGALIFMIIGFCMGICSGFSIPVAQRFGAKDEEGLRRFVANGVWLCIAFSVVMTIVSVAFCKQILVWTQTPEDVFEYAYIYLVVMFLGIPATILYNFLSGIIRALGDSKSPVYFLALASVLNVVLVLLFVVVFNWGVGGTAVGTVIAQGFSGVLCLYYIYKKFPILRLSKDEWKINGRLIRKLCAVGVPMGLQYSITAIGSVILQSAVNGLGSVIVAAVTAAQRVNMFFGCPIDALGATMATYGAQNVGAGKLDRLGKGLKSAIFIGAIYSVIAFIALYFFGAKMMLMFVNSGEKAIIQEAHKFLVVIGAFYIELMLVNVIRFMIQGMGFSMFAIYSGVTEMIARTFMGLVLVPVMGFTAVCFSNPLAWVVADLFLIPAFFYCRKQLKKMTENYAEAVQTADTLI